MVDPLDRNAEKKNKESSSRPMKPIESDVPQDPSDKKLGWIEGLAKRSSGLPGDTTPDKALPTPPSDKTLWQYAGLGIQFAGTIGLFAFFGYELDRWRGWSPWGLISLSMIAMIGSLYLLIKDALRDNQDVDARTKRRPPRT
jgi:F0F1-type ATP synthase assembly protein I